MSEPSANTDAQTTLTPAEAEALLPDGEEVHTFVNPGGMLVGADWDRATLLKALSESIQIQRSGEMASRMDHGIVFWEGTADKGRYIFVATRKP